MKQYIKQMASVAILGAASTVALAAPPSSPVSIPTAGAIGTAGSGASLVLAVWDPITQRSIVENLGLTLGQIGIADMTVPGESLDFGSVNLSQLNGSTANFMLSDNVQYAVFAGNATYTGTFTSNGLQFATTGSGFSSIANSLTGAGQVKGAINAVTQYGNNVFNSAGLIPGGTTVGCSASVNPCVTLGDGDGRYFGSANYGSQLAALPAGVTVSANIGTAQNFYSLVTSQTGAFKGGVAVTQYASGPSIGSFLLSTNGALKYSVPTATPLPAALWLILSGLGGMGVVSRRRRSSETDVVAA